MDRVLPIAGVALLSLGLTGCGAALDTITSRKFRQDPLGVTQRAIVPEDPLVVLRADPPRDGDDRAKAIRRLKEPTKLGLSPQDQDDVIDLLARTSTADPSPVLRLAAIDALGRFDDPRAAALLTMAYQQAHGRPEGAPDPVKAAVVPAASRIPGRSAAPLVAPTGYAPETVAVIRCRALDALGRTGQPEAARFLATVAAPPADTAPDGADDRDVRLAAVRGLGKCRHPEAVAALSQVLTAEGGKDPAVVGRAHDGLVRLTGKRLPPDPREWEGVVQAGVVIAPEPTWVDDAVETAAGWVK